MCLKNCKESIQEVKKLEKDVITCYKFMCKRKLDGTVCLVSPYQEQKYKPGVNYSNFIGAKCYRNYVNEGIHVFKDKAVAKKHKRPQTIVVEFTAMKSDLIGANEDEMVFTKVHLSEKEHKERTRNRKGAK